jgi:predicted GNAT family acetyltransferase
VIDDLLASHRSIPGINCRAEIADRFVAKWCARTGDTAEVAEHLINYRLAKVESIPISSGAMRQAEPSDFDLILNWTREFSTDVAHPYDEARTRANITNGLAGGQIFLWGDGSDNAPVAMARVVGGTKEGIRISLVYTPPENRGKGYASSLVAKLSQLQLDSGRKYCFLFTNAANPTSNKIYQRIGYEEFAGSRTINLLKQLHCCLERELELIPVPCSLSFSEI